MSERNKVIKEIDTLVRTSLKERVGYTCAKCGKKKVASKFQCHASHLIPTSKGLAHRWDEENILIMCGYCHKMWWHKNPYEAMRWLKTYYPERYEYVKKHNDDKKKYTLEELRVKLEEVRKAYL